MQRGNLDSILSELDARSQKVDTAIQRADTLLSYLQSGNRHLRRARNLYVELAWQRYAGKDSQRLQRLSTAVEENLERARRDGIDTEYFSLLEAFYDVQLEKDFRRRKEKPVWYYLYRLGATTAPPFTPDSWLAEGLKAERSNYYRAKELCLVTRKTLEDPQGAVERLTEAERLLGVCPQEFP